MTDVGVTGGRDYNDYATIEAVLNAVLSDNPNMVLHVGDASGLDTLAKAWAVHHGVHIRTYRANWEQYGRAAGPIRNRLIVDNSDVLYAFPGGRGTTNCIEMAKRAGIPVWRIT